MLRPIYFINKFLVSQVVVHLSVLVMFLYAEPKHYVLSLCMYFLTGCFGVSMTVHRLLAHRSWRAPIWFEWLGSLLATLGLVGSPLAWASVHRFHHQFVDTERDPHSPKHQGFLSVQFFSMKYKPSLKNVKDIIRDPVQKCLHTNYFFINICFSLILLSIEPFAVVYLHLFPAFILWHASSAINTLGHTLGYKNYLTKDDSVNNPVLGLLMFGEGWHNNHHRYQKSAMFGHKWYELDISGYLIYLLRLKKNNRVELKKEV